jgi:hypothetical protein
MADAKKDRSKLPISISPMGEEPPDRDYWLSQSPGERLDALEELRQRYISTLPDAERRFQKVLRVIRSE